MVQDYEGGGLWSVFCACSVTEGQLSMMLEMGGQLKSGIPDEMVKGRSSKIRGSLSNEADRLRVYIKDVKQDEEVEQDGTKTKALELTQQVLAAVERTQQLLTQMERRDNSGRPIVDQVQEHLQNVQRLGSELRTKVEFGF